MREVKMVVKFKEKEVILVLFQLNLRNWSEIYV